MFILKINTENAAFEEYLILEVLRILEGVIYKLNQGLYTGPLDDINGNKVGYYRLR